MFFYNASKQARTDKTIAQGSSNLSLEGQSAAEFSSNPDQTHLPSSSNDVLWRMANQLLVHLPPPTGLECETLIITDNKKKKIKNIYIYISN